MKNLEINYKIFEADKPQKTFLILHGWPSSSDKWEAVAELLTQKGIQSIVPDLPGFGKSQQPREAWSMDTYVEWIYEFCQQVPELQHTFYLAGHSFGGSLAAKFAIQYNQKLEKLFLISPSAIREKTAKKKILYRISKIGKIFSFLPYYEKLRKGFYKFIVGGSDYLYVSGVMKETYLKGISDDLSYKLHFIKVPTVIIWGDKDTSTPVEQANFIHEKIIGSKLVIIPEADHSPHIKIPDILADKIAENV